MDCCLFATVATIQTAPQTEQVTVVHCALDLVEFGASTSWSWA